MSGETEKDVSAWTIDSLHSHVIKLLELNKEQSGSMIDAVDIRAQRRIDELAHLLSREIATHDQRHQAEADTLTHRLQDARAALEAALASAQRETDKAEEAQKLRNETMNEFRGQLRDIMTTLARQDYVEQVRAALAGQIAENTNRIRAVELAMSQQHGEGEGGAERTMERQRAVATVMPIISAVVAVISIAVAVIIATR